MAITVYTSSWFFPTTVTSGSTNTQTNFDGDFNGEALLSGNLGIARHSNHIYTDPTTFADASETGDGQNWFKIGTFVNNDGNSISDELPAGCYINVVEVIWSASMNASNDYEPYQFSLHSFRDGDASSFSFGLQNIGSYNHDIPDPDDGNIDLRDPSGRILSTSFFDGQFNNAPSPSVFRDPTFQLKTRFTENNNESNRHIKHHGGDDGPAIRFKYSFPPKLKINEGTKVKIEEGKVKLSPR